MITQYMDKHDEKDTRTSHAKCKRTQGHDILNMFSKALGFIVVQTCDMGKHDQKDIRISHVKERNPG